MAQFKIKRSAGPFVGGVGQAAYRLARQQPLTHRHIGMTQHSQQPNDIRRHGE
ncbi:MAG TPA: hypothetical protein VME45_23060 [Stellaceae bacterium]|nr:hypothetical protein [Stellaceae bacterium]